MRQLVFLKTFFMIFAVLSYLKIAVGASTTCVAKNPWGFCFRMNQSGLGGGKLPKYPPYYGVQKPVTVTMNSGIATFDCSRNQIDGVKGSVVKSYCCKKDIYFQAFPTTEDYEKFSSSTTGGAGPTQISLYCLT